MCTQPRQTWLVPLLGVPLSHIAISSSCTNGLLDWTLPRYNLDRLHDEAT